jgi:acyl carrier protein
MTPFSIEDLSSTNKSSSECQHIQTELVKLFSDRLNVEVPYKTADLFEAGILDSQKFVELLLYIEQTFSTKMLVEQFEIENFRSVDRIADLILQNSNFTKLT